MRIVASGLRVGAFVVSFKEDLAVNLINKGSHVIVQCPDLYYEESGVTFEEAIAEFCTVVAYLCNTLQDQTQYPLYARDVASQCSEEVAEAFREKVVGVEDASLRDNNIVLFAKGAEE